MTEHAHHESHWEHDWQRRIEAKLDGLLCMGERIMSAQDQTNAFLDAIAPLLTEIGSDIDLLMKAAQTNPDFDPATAARVQANLTQISELAAKFTPAPAALRANQKR